MLSSRRSCAVLFVLFAALPACAVQPFDSDEPERIGDDSQTIKGGSLATDYPESVLLTMTVGGKPRSLCSGSLIAPSVVLTAGHCVHGFDSWTVTAPFAGSQRSFTKNATTFDWSSGSDSVDPDAHDVALVLLDTPITLASYPTIATTGLADGARVVNVGRINNGTLSSSALYASKPLKVSSAADAGYQFDYMASEVIEHGDSGGPVFIPGTHTLVAVNSGGGGGTEILARVDLLHDWILKQIAAESGSGTRSQEGNDPGNGPALGESDPADPVGAADQAAATRAGPAGAAGRVSPATIAADCPPPASAPATR